MEAIFENLFLKVLNMSITASFIILAIIIARVLLKRVPKKYSYALWLAAAFRLVCPVSFRSSVSLFALDIFNVKLSDSVLEQQGSEIVHIHENIGLMTQPAISTPLPILNEAVNSSLPAATPMYSVNPMQIWIFLAMLLWVLGVAVLAMVSIASFLRLCRSLKTATRLEGNIWQSERVRSPFIIGVFKPKIYLPYGLEGPALGYVLAHERAHIRRGDHVVRILAFVVLCLHWFNPLVWLAYYLMGRDMELSSDEKVLSKLGNKKEYSETLLFFAVKGRFPKPTPLAFGESGVSARIKNALKWGKSKWWVSLIAVVLCFVIIVVCVANPKQKDDGWELDGRWIGTECVYISPAISYIPPDGDNGRIYEFYGEGDGVRVFDSLSGGFVGGFGPVNEWQDFPYSDEEWEEMFIGYESAFSASITELYDEIKYMEPVGMDLNSLPVQEGMEEEFWAKSSFFMLVDGQLWYVSTNTDSKGKVWVNTIYALQREEEVIGETSSMDEEELNPTLWETLISLENMAENVYLLEGGGFNHSEWAKAQVKSVLDALGNISPDELKVGRGAPWQSSIAVQLPSGSLLRFGYCGDFVELQLQGEIAEKYAPEMGVWEIHNDTLVALLAAGGGVLTNEAVPESYEIVFDIPNMDMASWIWEKKQFVESGVVSERLSGKLTEDEISFEWLNRVNKYSRNSIDIGHLCLNIWSGTKYIDGSINFTYSVSEDGLVCEIAGGGGLSVNWGEKANTIVVSAREDFRPGIFELISQMNAEDVRIVDIKPEEFKAAVPENIETEILKALKAFTPADMILYEGHIYRAELTLAAAEGTITMRYDEKDEVDIFLEGAMEEKYGNDMGVWATDNPQLIALFDSVLKNRTN